MSLTVPLQGEAYILNLILNAVDFKLHLYQDDVSISSSTTASSFTGHELTASGYAAATLTHGSWTISGTNTGTYPDVTFTMTAGATIYGYYVTTADNATLLWAERFSNAPFTLPSSGGTVTITPKLSIS